MNSAEPAAIRDALRSALLGAMKQGDRTAAATYRSALAAIDNAEAVPLSAQHGARAIENSVVGVGRTEAPRRRLTAAEVRAVLRAEIDEGRTAAAILDRHDPVRASRLRNGMRLLDDLVAVHGPTD